MGYRVRIRVTVREMIRVRVTIRVMVRVRVIRLGLGFRVIGL